MDGSIIGARVQIKSKSHYHGRFAGKFGEVVQDYEGSIAIRIDGIDNPRSKYGAFWFKENEIEIIESVETIMDENYITAEVAFLNGTNTDKTYRYALYDSSIQPEDIVVVQTGHHGLAVARIVSVAGEPNGPVSHGREVICRVDMSAYKERKARAAQLVELKHTWIVRLNNYRKRRSMRCWLRKTRSWRQCSRPIKNCWASKQEGELYAAI